MSFKDSNISIAWTNKEETRRAVVQTLQGLNDGHFRVTIEHVGQDATGKPKWDAIRVLHTKGTDGEEYQLAWLLIDLSQRKPTKGLRRSDADDLAWLRAKLGETRDDDPQRWQSVAAMLHRLHMAALYDEGPEEKAS